LGETRKINRLSAKKFGIAIFGFLDLAGGLGSMDFDKAE